MSDAVCRLPTETPSETRNALDFDVRKGGETRQSKDQAGAVVRSRHSTAFWLFRVCQLVHRRHSTPARPDGTRCEHAPLRRRCPPNESREERPSSSIRRAPSFVADTSRPLRCLLCVSCSPSHL